MANNINIFGVKFAYPKGLRKSPGENWFADCVGSKMHKASGDRGDIKAKFAQAAKECKIQRMHAVEVLESEPAEAKPELESETEPAEAKPIETEPEVELESESQPASEPAPTMSEPMAE